MTFEEQNGEPIRQYWKKHFYHSNNSSDSIKVFEFEFKYHKILFNELEQQLVYIKDRINYIKSDKNEKNVNSYNMIEKEVQENLDKINNILENITEKIYQIDNIYMTRTNSATSRINFGDFSFVKKYLTEWREKALTIISLISGPLSI